MRKAMLPSHAMYDEKDSCEKCRYGVRGYARLIHISDNSCGRISESKPYHFDLEYLQVKLIEFPSQN